jgi:hypothetical protein
MTWTTSEQEAESLKKDNLEMVAFPKEYSSADKKVELVIDGQQRLSSIYGVVKGKVFLTEGDKEIDLGQLAYFPRKKDKPETNFGFVKKNESNKKGYLLVSELLDGDLFKISKERKLSHSKLKVVKNSILSYPIFFIDVRGAKEDVMSEIFLRINSQGTPVNSSDRAFSLSGSFDVRGAIDHVIRSLKESSQSPGRGYEKMKRKQIMIAIGAWNHRDEILDTKRRIGNEILQTAIKNLVSKRTDWPNFKKRLGKAAVNAKEFLVSDCGVHDFKQLQSPHVFTAMVTFYLLINRKANSKEKKFLKRLFWATNAYVSYYTMSGYDDHFMRDLHLLTRLAAPKPVKYKTSKPMLKLDDIVNTSYKKSGPIEKMIYVAMTALQPRTLSSPNEKANFKDIVIGGEKNNDHIFPKSLLIKRTISKKKQDSFANICFLTAEENNRIKKSMPRDYLKMFKKEAESKLEFNKALDSLLLRGNGVEKAISVDEITNRNFDAFLRKRAKLIGRSINKLAGFRVVE